MTRADKIIAEACERHGVARAEVMAGGNTRIEPIVRARHEACYRIRTELAWPHPKIGIKLNLDHSTVIHGVGRHYALINGLPIAAKAYGRSCNAVFREYAKRVTAEIGTEALRKAKPKRAKLAPVKANPPRPSVRFAKQVRENAHRADFVLEWIADGGTAHEALEPYGFCKWAAYAFLREHLPEIYGLKGQRKIRAAHRLWYGEEVAA